jgi:lysophospholipase L1-like esterase
MRRAWMRALALVLGLALAVAAGEVLLRVLRPVPLRLRGTEIVLPTNTTTTAQNTDSTRIQREITVRRNALGFRGPDPPPDFERSLTLVAVGGSTTEDCFLTDGRTWTDLCAGRLERELESTWLDNAGLDGHSTFGHLHLLDQLLLDLAPDYVLLLIGINDVDRDEPNDFDLRVMDARPSALERVVRASELLATFQSLRRSQRARDLGVGHIWELDLVQCKPVVDDPQGLEELFARQRALCLPRYRERVEQLVALSRAGGIEPILVTQPALLGDVVDPVTGIDIGPLECAGWSAATRWRLLEEFNDVTRAVGAERGVLVIELARQMPKDSLHFYDWMHFSNLGAEAAARIVAEALIPYLRARHPEHVRSSG